MSNSVINVNNIIEIVEIGLVVLGILGIAGIKLISYLEKRKLNQAQLEIIRNQSVFNNSIPLRETEVSDSQINGYHSNI